MAAFFLPALTHQQQPEPIKRQDAGAETPRKSYLKLPLVMCPVASFRAGNGTTKSQFFVIGGLKLFRLAPRTCECGTATNASPQ
ncbi:MAG: hypothetical protein ACREC0_04490 [Methylocella sp.]